MKIITRNIICDDEQLTLTNQRAVFWERKSMLMLSDVHIGKAGHFRKHGIPISSDILNTDLLRLEQLVHFFNPTYLMVVGDLFHARANGEFDVFENWLEKVSHLQIILVKGNHDSITPFMTEKFPGFTIAKSHFLHPFEFIHEPLKSHHTFQISGHRHPGVLIKGKGKQRVKLPCYQVAPQQLILPAFSLFTGLNTHKIMKPSISYAFTDQDIFEIKNI